MIILVTCDFLGCHYAEEQLIDDEEIREEAMILGESVESDLAEQLSEYNSNLIDELLIAYDLTIDDVYCHYQFAKKLCPCFKIEEFKEEYLNHKK